ncbi:MAG: hypothetical protein IPI97_04680 [Nitrosomonas sp.]|jgi:hypothetical protein|nr:hypothetical protein [Nitrosomonas sp.]MBK7364311.1 hypothetical protein [Nitrosomonas sp.]
MRKLILLMFMVLLLCGFRAPNGALISKGDLVDKLVVNLGQPIARIPVVTHRSIYPPYYSSREIWTYKIKQYNYRFVIDSGVIIHEDWTRF